MDVNVKMCLVVYGIRCISLFDLRRKKKLDRGVNRHDKFDMDMSIFSLCCSPFMS